MDAWAWMWMPQWKFGYSFNEDKTQMSAIKRKGTLNSSAFFPCIVRLFIAWYRLHILMKEILQEDPFLISHSWAFMPSSYPIRVHSNSYFKSSGWLECQRKTFGQALIRMTPTLIRPRILMCPTTVKNHFGFCPKTGSSFLVFRKWYLKWAAVKKVNLVSSFFTLEHYKAVSLLKMR